MKKRIALRLIYELDKTMLAIVEKAAPGDKFHPFEQEMELTDWLYRSWDSGVEYLDAHADPRKLSLDEILAMYDAFLGPNAVGKYIERIAPSVIAESFEYGQDSVDATFKKQTGKAPLKKSLVGFGFGQLFGLTEQHALEALQKQLVVSAGGFWESQFSASIKAEIRSFFDGQSSMEEVAEKMGAMTNTRLLSNSKEALPHHYFQNLATHHVTSARNVGALYRAKALGATSYRLRNPNDKRTSPICRKLTQGQTWPVAAAEQVVADRLSARSLEDLKTSQPFFKTGDESQTPVPPLHWPKCRTYKEYIFEDVSLVETQTTERPAWANKPIEE